jgi:general stress protein YciG
MNYGSLYPIDSKLKWIVSFLVTHCREGKMPTTKGSGTSKRGFASMDPEKQREIARKGGRAAHEKGTAHEFTPEEAAAAGRKGGQASGRGRVSSSR